MLYVFDGLNVLHEGGFSSRDELVDRLAGFVEGVDVEAQQVEPAAEVTPGAGGDPVTGGPLLRVDVDQQRRGIARPAHNADHGRDVDASSGPGSTVRW